MTLLDYFVLAEPDAFGTAGAIELVNVARTTAYMQHGLAPATFVNIENCGCDTVGLDGPEAYTLPAADLAPWYDPAVPESALFAGIIPQSVEGLDSNPVDREVTRLIGGGGQLGPLTFTEKTVEFRVELIGASCCAVAYGLQWLTAALIRRCSPATCDESDLVWMAACPNSADGCAPDIDEVRSMRRILTRVGLTKGPTVVERRGEGCGCGCNATIVVEFTLVAGNPRVFSETTEVLGWTNLVIPGDNCDDLHWICGPPEVCPGDLAIFDPACAVLPPPPAPLVTIGCFCEPVAVYRHMIDLEDYPPELWGASTISARVRTGDRPLRNVALRLFARDGADCGDDYPACDVLSSLGISYVPPNSTLTVDGVRRRAFITLGDGSRHTATRFVFATSGSVFEWLDMACGGSYCLSIEADAFNTHNGAQVSVTTTAREG